MDYDKSMMTVAEEVLKANGAKMTFKDLWDKVKEIAGVTPEEEAERVGYFYTDLSLARSTFVVLTNNEIDLRSRLEYKKYRIAYDEIDNNEEESKDDVDKKEDEETEAFVNSGTATRDESSPFDSGVATDGEGLEDLGKEVPVNDWIRSGSDSGSNF